MKKLLFLSLYKNFLVFSSASISDREQALHTRNLKLSFILLSFLISFNAYSIDFKRNCKVFFKELVLNENEYLNNYKELLESLGEIDKVERSKVLLTLDALHFINYYHQLDELLEVASGKLKVSDMKFSSVYNNRRANPIPQNIDYSDLLEASIAGATKKQRQMLKNLKDDSFSNFIEARNYLIAEKPEFNSKTFKKMQSILMKGGIDGLNKNKLGVYRDYAVIGNVPKDWAISKEEFEEVLKSPYLGFYKEGELSDGRVYGMIAYPDANEIQEKTLKIIQKRDKKLAQEIRYLQEAGAGDEAELNRRMVDVLIEDTFDWFASQRKSIGELKSASKVDKYIELVAEFQRRLISIHPFADGNGRTTREFGINYALMVEGLPPSRLVNPDDDLYSPMQSWKNQVKWGVLSTHKLVADFTLRAKMGLPFKSSPELLTPYLLRQIELSFKKSGSKKVIGEYKEVSVDTKQFMVFFKYMLRKHSDLPERLESDPKDTWKILGRAFRRFQNKNRTFYATKYEGEHEIGIHFVDHDFMETFGVPFFGNVEKWQAKMKTWYSDEMLWRGMSNTNKEVSEKEIVGMFKNISSHMVSNNILSTANSWGHEALKKKAIAEMNRYNDDLFAGGLAEIAMDHSRSGSKYAQSYGYSTSDKYSVGKAFAMGAMVIADYGKHADVELQKKLKSRIVVGARRAMKDVDLMRLKPLRDEFSNKYWRQSEVMGIAAADPDSIMIIKTLDEYGEPILSYVRNPKKPNEIWVIKGEFDTRTGKVPTKSQLEKVIEL